MTAFLNVLVFLAITICCSVVFASFGFALETALMRDSDKSSRVDPGLYELVLYVAVGIAVTCFVCFVSAIFQALYWPVVLLPLLIFTSFIFARDKNAFVFLQLLGRALSRYGWLPLLAGLILAVPSVLPDITSDGQAFHLIYAKEWADAHRLTVDPYIREPLYAMNWLTLDALFEMIGLGWYTPVLSGLCYVWSVAAIFALTRRFAPGNVDGSSSTVAVIVCCAATLTFLLSPTVMHWALTALVDGPIGFFFLTATMAAVLAFDRRSVAWTFVCTLLAGYFIGMKTSLFLFIPLWLAVSIYLGLRLPQRWKTAAWFAISFLVFGSPWYARNIILDGDPIAPTLNILLTGRDLIWSKHDFAGQLSDLGSNALAPGTILQLPFGLVFQTPSYTFRDYGVTFGYLLLYLPFVLLVVDLIRARMKKTTIFPPAALLVFASFSYAVAYYESTTVLARYALVFAPLLSACLGIVAARMILVRRLWPVSVVTLFLVAIPSPASYSWLTFNEQFVAQGLWLDRESFLAQRLDGYAAAKYVSAQLKSHKDRSSVYEVGAGNLCLVLRRGGNPCVGDWIGPSRFEDLAIAIHEDESADYVNRFGIAAFIIRVGGEPISDLTVAMLDKQLKPLDFHMVLGVDKNYIVLVRGAQS